MSFIRELDAWFHFSPLLELCLEWWWCNIFVLRIKNKKEKLHTDYYSIEHKLIVNSPVKRYGKERTKRGDDTDMQCSWQVRSSQCKKTECNVNTRQILPWPELVSLSPPLWSTHFYQVWDLLPILTNRSILQLNIYPLFPSTATWYYFIHVNIVRWESYSAIEDRNPRLYFKVIICNLILLVLLFVSSTSQSLACLILMSTNKILCLLSLFAKFSIK